MSTNHAITGNKSFKGALWCLRQLTLVLTVALTSGAATAQDASDRAGDIKLWRDQCNDSDPDLRTAYVEEAIENKGTTIKRICVRLALESSDDDVRNLGLRAAIAMQKDLTFKVEMQPELKAALSDAGEDEEKIEKLSNTYDMAIYNVIKNGLTFNIKDAEVATDRSTWFSYGALASPTDDYKGPASIVGDEITWVGNANLGGNYKCQLNAKLGNGAEMVGQLQCSSYWAFPISARLL